MQNLGFGNAADGNLSITSAGTTTEAPINSAATGTGGTDALSATNASFTGGQLILIHQTQGTGAGSWELNFIESYSAGTITTEFNLANTYASGAQVRVVPQYASVTIAAGATYTTTAWDGTKGGILFFVVAGFCSVYGIITTSALGFRGGAGAISVNGGNSPTPFAGEGYSAASTQSTSANGSGGAGGNGGDGGGGGGGGGHASTGNVGAAAQGSTAPGGIASGSADLTTMTFGGGGGGGKGESNANCVGTGTYRGGNGGRGGGIIGIMAYGIYVDPATGFITSNGEVGGSATGGCEEGAGGGGGGAGGSIYLVFVDGSIGVNRVAATGGSGGGGSGSFHAAGGLGANGRIALNGCSLAAGNTTNPNATQTIGGQDFCQAFIHIWDN